VTTNSIEIYSAVIFLSPCFEQHFSQYLGELSMRYIVAVFGPDTFRFPVFLEAERFCVCEREGEFVCVSSNERKVAQSQ